MTTPAARRDGNGTGKITRDAVLAAALEIIDRDGTDALSMRRLARALNRDPMILYRHAPNKAALLNGVAEAVLAQLHVDSADPDWAASYGRSPAATARWRWPTRTPCPCSPGSLPPCPRQAKPGRTCRPGRAGRYSRASIACASRSRST